MGNLRSKASCGGSCGGVFIWGTFYRQVSRYQQQDLSDDGDMASDAPAWYIMIAIAGIIGTASTRSKLFDKARKVSSHPIREGIG